MPYKAECSSCGWVFKESESTKIDDMPATCIKCKGDMRVAPCMKQEARVYSYQMLLQCKENGAMVQNSFIMKNEDLVKISDKGTRSKFVMRASDALARMITDVNSVNKMICVNNSKIQ